MKEQEAKEKIKEILKMIAGNRYNEYYNEAKEILNEKWDFLN